MGTLYSGIATATESAALGLVVAFVLVALQGRLNFALLETCFISSAKTTGMILLIVLGAFILNLALSLTGIGEALTKWVTGFGLDRIQLLLVLIVFYLILGMFMDTLSMMVATIPLAFPWSARWGWTRSGSGVHRADVRVGADHTARGHEPVRGAGHSAG